MSPSFDNSKKEEKNRTSEQQSQKHNVAQLDNKHNDSARDDIKKKQKI